MRGQPVRVSLLLQWGERAPGRGLRGRHGCWRLGGTLWKVPSPDGCGRSCPCPSRPSSLCTGARPSGEPAARGPASLGAPGARGRRCRRTPRRGGWLRPLIPEGGRRAGAMEQHARGGTPIQGPCAPPPPPPPSFHPHPLLSFKHISMRFSPPLRGRLGRFGQRRWRGKRRGEREKERERERER